MREVVGLGEEDWLKDKLGARFAKAEGVRPPFSFVGLSVSIFDSLLMLIGKEIKDS